MEIGLPPLTRSILLPGMAITLLSLGGCATQTTLGMQESAPAETAVTDNAETPRFQQAREQRAVERIQKFVDDIQQRAYTEKRQQEQQLAADQLARQQQLAAEDATIAAINASLRQINQRNNAWFRLQQSMAMKPVMNDRIRAQLDWYLKHRGYLTRVMERARPVLPFVLDELERRQLPGELALLPIVESAYQTFAYSHGRASGMWQIIPSTGRFLGLKQNWWYDGRRDIIDSTRAAAQYLEDLARQFDGDWELALASYNAGPGRIRSAIRYNKKKNKPTDFWHLTRFRAETRDYVPKLFALKELFQNPEEYELELLPIGTQPNYELVQLDAQIDLALAADLAGITINKLYQLNPALNRWATPPDGPHRLLLPETRADQFRTNLANVPETKRINWVRHKIRNGETLSQIALKYSSTVALIKNVNNIRGSSIRAGKHLMIPTATRSLGSYTLSESSRLAKIQNTARDGDKLVHIVRPGQSLWEISKNYGVSTRALAKWNGMAPIDTLRVGQKLVIWTNKTVTASAVQQVAPRNNMQTLRYTVRKGDSLYLIANKFNVRVSDIKRWNQVGKYLQPGQKLKLYVDVTNQSS